MHGIHTHHKWLNSSIRVTSSAWYVLTWCLGCPENAIVPYGTITCQPWPCDHHTPDLQIVLETVYLHPFPSNMTSSAAFPFSSTKKSWCKGGRVGDFIFHLLDGRFFAKPPRCGHQPLHLYVFKMSWTWCMALIDTQIWRQLSPRLNNSELSAVSPEFQVVCNCTLGYNSIDK